MVGFSHLTSEHFGRSTRVERICGELGQNELILSRRQSSNISTRPGMRERGQKNRFPSAYPHPDARRDVRRRSELSDLTPHRRISHLTSEHLVVRLESGELQVRGRLQMSV